MKKTGYDRLRTVLRIVFPILLGACIILIFLHSAEIGELSDLRSQQAADFINKILARLQINSVLSNHTVRKLGHFCEYFLLGLFLMLSLRLYTKRVLSHITWPLFLGLIIPILDETLQLFIPGRSGQLTDVLIDYGGVLCGIVLGLFIILIAREIHGRKK